MLLAAAADRHDQELAPTCDVGHRAAARGVGQLRAPDLLAGRLVEGVEEAGRRSAGREAAGALLVGAGHLLAGDDEHQGPGRHRPAGSQAAERPGAERPEVETGQRRMVARAVPERRLPQDFASVQIDRSEAAPGRLGQRQTLGSGRERESGQVVAVGALAPGRRVQGHRAETSLRRHEQDAALRVDGGAAPVRAAGLTGQLGHRRLAVGAGHDRRREQRPAQEGRTVDLDRPGVQLRREVDQIALAHALAVEGRRLGGEGLHARGPFAGDGALRHLALLDRPHGLAGLAVEDVGEGLLADLGYGLDPLPVDLDVEEDRSAGEVVVPESVPHRLEVPLLLAGRGVDGDQALGVEIVPVAVAAVVVAGRRAGTEVDPARLVVAAHPRPHVAVAGVAP